MNYHDFLANMNQLGSTLEDICSNTLGVNRDKINEIVVISPGWFPERVFSAWEIEELVSSSPLFQYKIWNIKQDNLVLTYIKTGFGASVVMDCLLLLGVTGKCKKIYFVSSIGGLSNEINIGDIVLPEYALCGDGTGRYLSDDLRMDFFCEKQYPNNKMFNKLVEVTRAICQNQNVKWHLGRTFCIDTIVAQGSYLGQVIDMGCNTIDMESAVAFRVAKMLDVPIVAIMCVSDNSVKENQSLMSKRSESEIKYRRFVTKEIVPQIILKSIEGNI